MSTFDFDQPIDRRASDSNKWNKYPADVLPLWVADMDFASPPVVLAALRARVEHGVFGYLTEEPPLREVVAERLGKRYGWQVEPEAVMLIPGVIAGFNLALKALTSPGDGLLVQVPAYPPILRSPGNHGLRRDEQPLARTADGRYTVDLDAFAAAFRPDTRAFLLCNPHNPVGRVFERRELEAMAATCLQRRAWILADEIHCDLLLAGHTHVPIASLSREVEDRTVTFMAPSKTFNLPGLKCAVAIVPNSGLRQRLAAAVADLVPKVNVLGHAAAVAAYREGDDWLAALLRYLEASRDLVVQEAATLPGVAISAPEATCLAWLDCRATGLDDPYTFFLQRARVALNDGRSFGPGGAGFVRLNFGCRRATLREALARMRAALAR